MRGTEFVAHLTAVITASACTNTDSLAHQALAPYTPTRSSIRRDKPVRFGQMPQLFDP